MSASQPVTAPANPAASGGWHREAATAPDAQVRLAELQLRQLAEIREVGMRVLEDLDEERDKPIEKRMSVAQRGATFDRVSKAIRQIMALEQEVIGMREKRVHKVAEERTRTRGQQVKQSVEQSLKTARPGMDRPQRERLLSDLFVDYRKFATGNIPDLIAGICKDLGIQADLSLWEEPNYQDIALPSGYDWIVPVNGDKPYTVVDTPAGIQVRRPFDSHHFARGGAPPDG